ncbi:hypothetical protein Tco_0250372 [Tanacetum coccineum]
MAALQYFDDHNRIAYLGRERGSEDFTDILSYLDHSPLRYALTHDPPVVFDSLVKQFWATATVRPNAAGSHDWFAAIDGREVKCEGEAIPWTPPMLPLMCWQRCVNEDNEPTPGEAALRQNGLVPIPVCLFLTGDTWPSVPEPSPLGILHLSWSPPRPARTGLMRFEEPFVFGPVPKPAGYVDPDNIDPIIFGPPPRPYDFVDPILEESVIFGPLPRPANYIEPEDITHLNSMEDETILGGFHEETHAGPDDAPTPNSR